MAAKRPPRDEYPRPMLRRRDWVNLNGEWEFGAGDERQFDRVINVPFCPQSELSGIADPNPGDVVWYRRRFEAPPAERLLLHFGAVDYRATVWVNGEEVATHEGGHTPFAADISKVVRAGDNELVVRAEDPLGDRTTPRGKQYWTPRPESIFYTATIGIWQTVWLEPLPARSLGSAVRIEPDAGAGAVTVHMDAEGRKSVTVTLHGEEAGHWSGTHDSCRIELSRRELWSPEAPHLYSVDVVLHDRAGREVDHVSSHFGLRTIAVRDGKFWLNGEPYFQRLVLDQGYFPGGLLTAANDSALRRDIELAKSLGFNGARKHQKIEDPRWLYWADRLGFLVWEEMPDFHEHSPEAERRLAQEWEQAVMRDRGHACIVAWVPLNESFGLQGVEPSVSSRFLEGLYHFTHDLDGTRPVISNDGWEHTHTDMCTLHDYNPAHALKRRYGRLYTALDAAAHPKPLYLPGYEYGGEPLVVSEFGGIALARSGGFGWSEAENTEEFVDTYREMVEALTQPGPVEGFGYTQLCDVEQERNGLLTFDRKPKADIERLREITETPKR
ncbi:MAG TPA: glycoside hydrolase family 2 TIM barrel-domain containing protein [Candidatus Dormibacteraeota bacterium]|nr:glycoside hydrolase family 2 TIM barrel-domain containing protein [Candidatus Dormibacteraeota bacterium]